MKALLLARVSTEEQKEAGNSLPSQLTRLQKYCDEKGLEIVKQYNFDESAWKTEREEFKKIIDSLQHSKETTALCCDKIDRLIRNFTKDLVILEELRRKGKIELHFPSDNIILHKDSPATDLFRFTIGVSLAKYYSDSISDNVKRAYENKIRKGEWIGKAPLGYMYVEDEKGKRDIIPDPVISPFIIRMFELYATRNYSIIKIQDMMTKHGFINKINQKPLVKSYLFYILQNPFYYGMMKVKNKLYPHKYLPLIKKELFDEVQKVRLGWNKKPCKYKSKPFIFRGLIKCAECGCTVTPEKQKGHIYYSCTNYHKMHEKRIYVNEEDILKPIYKVLDGIKLSDDKIKELVDDLRSVNKVENKFFMNIIHNLQREYDQLEEMIDKITELRCHEKISEELYLRKLEKYADKQKKILEDIDRHDTADKNHYITANTILSLAQKSRKVFDSSEVIEKRQLLNFILQNCELKGKKLQYTLKSPFDTILLAGRCSKMCPIKNVFRTLDWKNIEFMLSLFESELTNTSAMISVQEKY